MIPNGSFDSDISGWNLHTTPDTTVGWDSDGLPDGSLRIDTSWAYTGVIDVESACFLVERGRSTFGPEMPAPATVPSFAVASTSSSTAT
jgi:hypothetical protein